LLIDPSRATLATARSSRVPFAASLRAVREQMHDVSRVALP
jgi:hypothetical protein